MKLYFLRHGIAEEGTGVNDHDRRLTNRGIHRMQTAARVIAGLGIRPVKIYSSPRVRARQTAEIVAEALKRDIDIRDEVNFNFSIEAVETLIDGLKDDAEVMFVGHEPSMSNTLRLLTGGAVIMKKGGLARVDLTRRSPLHGELIWLIPPRVFSALVNSADADEDED